jgi:hypothetical protein
MMFIFKEIKRYWIVPVVFFLLFSLSGCFYAVIGGVGALGGYAVSPDTVEGETQMGYEDVWKSSMDVLSIMGHIRTSDYKLGSIEAEVNRAVVWIELSQLQGSWVRLRVRARKNMLPKIKLAQDIWVKIKNRMTP